MTRGGPVIGTGMGCVEGVWVAYAWHWEGHQI